MTPSPPSARVASASGSSGRSPGGEVSNGSISGPVVALFQVREADPTRREHSEVPRDPSLEHPPRGHDRRMARLCRPEVGELVERRGELDLGPDVRGQAGNQHGEREEDRRDEERRKTAGDQVQRPLAARHQGRTVGQRREPRDHRLRAREGAVPEPRQHALGPERDRHEPVVVSVGIGLGETPGTHAGEKPLPRRAVGLGRGRGR